MKGKEITWEANSCIHI